MGRPLPKWAVMQILAGDFLQIDEGSTLAGVLPALAVLIGAAGCAFWRSQGDRRDEDDGGPVRAAVPTVRIDRQRPVSGGERGYPLQGVHAAARRAHHPQQEPAAPAVPQFLVPRAMSSRKDVGEHFIELAEMSVEEDEELKKNEGKDGYFRLKLAWLDRELGKLHQQVAGAKPIKVEVDRNDLFHDSFRAFARLSREKLRCPFQIKFKKEEGRDDGGLTRAWFMLISREVVKPDYAMFVSLAEDHRYHIHSASKHQPHHLDYFKFMGRVWGKAAYDGFLIESHLTSAVYKYLLGIPITRGDLQHVDGAYHQSLQWLLDNDIDSKEEGGTSLDMTFAIDEEELGCVTTVELKEAGSKIPVTNANKHEYIELASMRRLVTGIQPQLDAFKAGFREVFPSELLEKFTEDELELVLCGLPAIDVQDWRANSLYRAGYTAESDVVVWFWEIVEGWDQAMRARLLQFVTGTSNVPTGGFGELYGANGPKLFQIIRVFDVTRLPQANTCFNELLLPPYASKEILAELLCMAILDGGDHFNLR